MSRHLDDLGVAGVAGVAPDMHGRRRVGVAAAFGAGGGWAGPPRREEYFAA